MHNVLIISYIAFSIGNLFILPESAGDSGHFYLLETGYSFTQRTGIPPAMKLFPGLVNEIEYDAAVAIIL